MSMINSKWGRLRGVSKVLAGQSGPLQIDQTLAIVVIVIKIGVYIPWRLFSVGVIFQVSFANLFRLGFGIRYRLYRYTIIGDLHE